MRQWVEEHCDTEQGRELYSGVVRSLCCVEPSEVSALCWMQAVDACGGTERMLEVEGGAQERTIIGGSQQISERMRDTVGTERVLLDRAVSSIDWDERKTAAGVTEAQDIAAGINTRSITVSASSPPIVIRCRDGSCYYSRRVIVAVSPALYESLRFQPYLPSWKQQPTSRMHMGSIIKTVMRYERPWWRVAGCSGALFDTTGDILISALDDCSDDAAASPSSSSSPFYALVGFIAASAARQWQQRSPAQRQQAVCAQYQRVFQCEAALHPVSYSECDWAAEAYSRGGYSAISPPLVITALDEALRAPTAGIHYAGSETAVQWSGYMSGAVEAGERAAHEVLQALDTPELGQWQAEEAEGADWECRAAGSHPSQHYSLYLPRASTAYWAAVITSAAVASAALWRCARLRL